MFATCPSLDVPIEIMASIVRVESASNQYAIGVVGDKLIRQPRSLEEAVVTADSLERMGMNFSIGLAQINRHNLKKYGLTSYKLAFDACTNLVVGSKILNECYSRSSQNWGKAFSCYYSGNFETGFKHGYVRKVTDELHKLSMSKPLAKSESDFQGDTKTSSLKAGKSSTSSDEIVRAKTAFTLNDQKSCFRNVRCKFQREKEADKSKNEMEGDMAFIF